MSYPKHQCYCGGEILHHRPSAGLYRGTWRITSQQIPLILHSILVDKLYVK